MHVEQLGAVRERGRERVDRRPVPPFGEVRHRLERQLHGAYSKERYLHFIRIRSLCGGKTAARAKPVRPLCGAAKSAPEGAVKAYYDRRAIEYDDWWLGEGLYADRDRPGWEEERRVLEDVIAALPPLRTLDVACGTGFLTRHLRGDVVGLDQSKRMLAVAREQAPRGRFVQGEALRLPFDDGEFDRLFTSYFYCHLEAGPRRRFVAEARR